MSKWHVCLCWVLCISVWRGPVPIVHDHDLDLQSLGNNVCLAEHAIEFHADHLGENSAGLHLHFVMLDSCMTAVTADASDASGSLMKLEVPQFDALKAVCPDAAGADWVLSAEQQARDLSMMSDVQYQLSFGECVEVVTLPSYSANADSSFLQTQLSGASTCAVLCVFLC